MLNITKKINLICSITSLLISITTIYLTYTIGSTQNKITKLEYSPIFVLQDEYIYDEAMQKNVTEKITIINEGYPINNFEEKTNNFILATLYDKSGKEEIIIPVIYYGISFNTSGGKEKLSTLMNPNNNLNFFNLYNSALELKGADGESILSLKLITVIKIDYLDPLDGVKTAYFIDNKASTKENADAISSKSITNKLYPIEQIKISDILNLFSTK